jgi:hypothetical protein
MGSLPEKGRFVSCGGHPHRSERHFQHASVCPTSGGKHPRYDSDEVHQQAANIGEVRTLYGRCPYLPKTYSTFAGEDAEVRRHAVNTVVQGTAADMLRIAPIGFHDTLRDDVRMLVTVHDSVLLFEATLGIFELAPFAVS